MTLKTETKEIRVERIHPNPDNPRDEAGDVTELADQIESEGQVYDAIVTPDPNDDRKYILLDGYRRWVAMRARGYETMTCKVQYLDSDVDLTVHTLMIGLITSTAKPLNAMERARAYGKLIKKGLKPAEIGRRLGKHPTTITKSLELLDLAPRTQRAVAEGKLSVKDAHAVVAAHRKDQRKRQGHGSPGAEWERPWFGPHWPLANRAIALCRGLNHKLQNLMWPDGPCQRCVDQTIRMDQDEIRSVDFQSAGLALKFQSAPNFSADVEA
jgi:ParB family transcriptional regulator, chromosome partitioning protein